MDRKNDRRITWVHTSSYNLVYLLLRFSLNHLNSQESLFYTSNVLLLILLLHLYIPWCHLAKKKSQFSSSFVAVSIIIIVVIFMTLDYGYSFREKIAFHAFCLVLHPLSIYFFASFIFILRYFTYHLYLISKRCK